MIYSRQITAAGSPSSVTRRLMTWLRVSYQEGHISDKLYLSFSPMLVLGAELEILSTPFGERSIFSAPEYP
jgi:hypothetical protein